jgi:hypothetical protein
MVFSYAGSGSISPVVGFDFGVISYSYNPSSVVPFIYVDLGTLGAPTATIDHGSVTEPTTGQEDWGDMRYDQQTRFPFGVVRLASSTTFVVKKVFVGSGQLFELGEAFTRLQAPWIVEGTISLRGEANAAFLYRYDASGIQHVYGDAAPSFTTLYEGSGSLFSTSFTGEAKATVYPEQPRYSVADIDYASDLFTNNPRPGSSLDPTLGTSLVSGGTGVGTSGGFNVGPHIRFGGSTGGTNGYRRVLIKKDLRNVDQLEIYAIKGNRFNGGEEPDVDEDLQISFASNFVDYFGDFFTLIPETDTNPDLQRIIIDVPEGAKREDQEVTFYQLESSGTQYDHYGLVSVRYLTASEPTDGDTRKTLFEVGGDALILASLGHVGSGTLFNIGSIQPLRTFAYDGSGTLFGFGNETRSLTYAYPGTDFFTYEDYGQVAAATTQPNEDFGSLFRDPGDDVYEIFDRGEILVNYTKYPHGLFKLRSETVAAKLTHITGTGDIFVVGDARTKGPQNHYGEGTFFIEGASKATFSLQEFGSGFISTLSGAAETVTASPDEEDKLLNFRGVAGQSRSATPAVEGLDVKVQGVGLTRFIPRYNGSAHLDIDGGLVTEKVTLAHLGTGVLFDFIGAEERRVYSYNTSSIDFITHPNYGFVADAATTFEDYGDLDLRYTGETGWMSTPDIRVDYHGILDNYTNYPFGLLPLKGTGETPRLRAFTGSGTFTVRGEVFIFVPPVWDGQGVITIEGSAEEAFVSREQFQTLFEFKGTLENVNIGRGYQGTGVISTLSGAAEAFTGNPQEREALFSFLGEAQSRFIPRYNGSVLLDIDGGLVTEKVTLAHQATGSLFSFIGADEARVYSYNSTSIDFLVPIDLGSVAAVPSTSAEPVAVYTETDFGTLDLVYTGEQGWFSTPDDRQDWQYILDHDTTYPFGLFERFGGTAVPVINLKHVGGGSLGRFSGEVELAFPNLQDGQGIIFIRGAATSEKIGVAESFNVLFETTGFADVITTVSLEQDVKVEITGLAGVSFTGNTVQDATIFVTGASSEVRARGYQGSGSIFSNGILSESVTKTFPLVPGYTANLNLTATNIYNRFGTSWTGPSHGVHPQYGSTGENTVAWYPNGGSGTCMVGGAACIDGFDVGPHFRIGSGFGSNGAPRELKILLDLTNVEEITLSIIRGNFENGGSLVHDQDHLRYRIDIPALNHTGGSHILVNATDTSFDSLKDVTISTYPGERVNNAVLVLEQPVYLDTMVSAWGFTGLNYVVNRPGDQRKNLFDVTGESVFRTSQAHQGFGTLFGLSGASESKSSDEVFSSLIDIFGEAVVISARGYEGTGVISTLSGTAESFTASPDDLFSLFDLTGSVSDSTTKGFVGSGSLFSLSGASESATFREVFAKLRLDITGEAVVVSARGYTGTGVISTLSGAAEAFTASPDDLFSLFDFTGGITSIKSTVRETAQGALFDITGEIPAPLLTFAEQPEVQARIFGAGAEAFVPNWNGRGRISTLSGAAESITINARERELLFSIAGSAEESFSFANYDADSAARIFGAIPKPPTLVFAESGFGTFTASGEGEYAHVDIYGGFGTIFAKGIGGESVTRRIPAFQADLALSGFAGKAVTFNPPDITTHLRITGEGIVPIRTFIESFTVRLTTDGTARERFVPNHIGDGAIASRGIGGEAISRRLPAFQADMFISGFAGQKTTVREQFFGSLFTFSGSSAPELLAFAEEREVQVEVSGESKVRFSLLHIGEGRISTLSGAAESATFNPRERELLFSFGGGVSDIKITKAETKQIEVSVTGEATDVRFIPNWIVEGTIPVSGIAHTTRSVIHTGEGFISTLSGAAESFTYNPTEDTALFTFLGTAAIRSAVSEVKTVSASIFNEPVKVIVIKSFIGSGVVPVSGQKDERTARAYEGTGVISTLSGSAESFTVNPDDLFTLFNVLGVADTRPISVYTKIGSGALFTSFTAGEARAISVPVNVPSQESKGLFKLEGSSPESFTIPYEGSGSLFSFEGLDESRTFTYETEGTVTVSGIASTPRTRDYEGSGSLFSFIEAESAVRFIATTRTVLFDITGESVFRTTQAHEGTGSLFTTFTAGESRTFKVPQHLVPNLTFLGAARIKNTYRYQGENHLEITGSAQESFTPTVYKGDVRLKTSGESVQKFVAAETSQGGTIKVRGAATFLTTNAFQTYTLFDIVGVADVTKSTAFSGSGTIFTFVSAEEVGPDREFEAGGTITLRGESVDKKVSVAPERTYGWII